jgi:PKD repeat protein
MSDSLGCDGATIFLNAASLTQGAPNIRWYWNAGGIPPPFTPKSKSNPTAVRVNTQDADNTLPNYGLTAANANKQFAYTRTDGLPQAYNIVLQADNDFCFDNKSATITIYPIPEADLIVNPSSGVICQDDILNLSAANESFVNSTTHFEWNFGDLTIKDTYGMLGQPVDHKYNNLHANNTTPYRVIMTVSNTHTFAGRAPLVCRSRKDNTVQVGPHVRAAFDLITSNQAICAPANDTAFPESSLVFMANTQGSVGGVAPLVWNFDAFSADMTTAHTGFNVIDNGRIVSPALRPTSSLPIDPIPNAPMHFLTTLTASNGICHHTSDPMIIILNPRPRIDFTPDLISGCNPLTVKFTNVQTPAASYTPASYLTYDLNFGNGISQTFPKGGFTEYEYTYNNTQYLEMVVRPSLTGTNDYGCASTIRPHTITVAPFMYADFWLDTDDPNYCSPATIRIINTSRGYHNFVLHDGFSVIWAGNNTDNLYEHTFTTLNGYQDRLYNLRMTVERDGVCFDTKQFDLLVNAKPIANFSPPPPFSPYAYPAPPLALVNSVNPTDRYNIGYRWSWSRPDMGIHDRVFATNDPYPVLRLSDWGTYRVTQRVIAPNGICYDEMTLPITISVPDPIASFADVPDGCASYTVEFHNQSRYDSAWFWDFGDGMTSSEKHPTHTFNAPNTYTVRLTVWNNATPAQSHTIEKTVTVLPTPRPSFTIPHNRMYVGQTVTTENKTEHSFAGTDYGVRYEWNFGDGSPLKDAKEPIHAYLKEGVYDISLTAITTDVQPYCSHTFTMRSAITVLSPGNINMPNVFRPRPEGEQDDTVDQTRYSNHLFFAPVLAPTRYYKMTIHNRLGVLLFETEDRNRGWNGFYRGRMLEEGIYIWKIEAIFETGEPFLQVGDILLLR